MTVRPPADSPARLARWAVPVAVLAAAAALRIPGVGGPEALIFDETYYVKDALTLWHLGYEGTWGQDPNPAFEAGDTSGYTAAGSFVAHPPLGKWIIALGMAAFGDGPFGWRIATAVAGTLLVGLVYLVGLRLSRSAPIAGVAAGLVAIDPLAIAMSRVALLDTHLAVFLLLGFWFVLLDRDRTARAIRAGAGRDPIAGPVVWARPWILAAGLAFGCATAVKWSGLYAIAVVGIALVAADAIDRRRAGIRLWAPSAIGRQGPATFLLFVPPAAAAYLVAWSGWLVTSGGYGRAASANPLAALVEYHRAVFAFHAGVDSPHTYASPAIEWIAMLNPTLMYRETPSCAGGRECVALMAALPNPLMWWLGAAAVAAFAIRLVGGAIRRRPVRGAEAFVLVGVAATYAPWLLLPGRTMFSFYAVTVLPFVALAYALALQRIRAPRPLVLLRDASVGEIQREQARADAAQRTRRAVTSVVLGATVVVALFFLPFGTGWPLPEPLYRAHLWLPSWFL
ncbi:phospholipid carrier-dependent glycosyltransferase [Microbacterium sp. ZXX196]|uniref:dolichyl-phosphate-mannose--protein mannosyltransferase n=1 Tax=Microbacterium sp. ZXX196 TaxID=2609291 RepID=UPI0012BA3187|nr:phospholipid carrier-dependent glycosyltransferase [Microbacterium sp. ZXX196]